MGYKGTGRYNYELKEYYVWASLKQRCLNPKDRYFNRYGSRGITVCQEWIDSFEAFYADMGSRPSPKHSIERIDNNGNYCKENCRWATAIEQSRNRNACKMITYKGITQCLKAWAESIGISYQTLIYRLKRGWSVENTLSKPVVQTKRIYKKAVSDEAGN